MDDSKIKKIEYLNRYIKSKEKYIFLDNQLKGVHSTDLNYIKSTVHKSLTDKIHDRDLAYDEMITSYIEISNVISTFPFWYQPLLYNTFINGNSLDELAKSGNTTKDEIKADLDYCINHLRLNQ